MLTLAIDTATKICTVALCRDQQLLAEYNVNVGMTHSEGLLPQLEQLLKRTGIKKNEIELLAVSMVQDLLPVCVSVWLLQRLWLIAGNAFCMVWIP